MLASTLVTTLKSSEVHSNVASHGLLLQLDDAKAGMMVASVRVTNRFCVSRGVDHETLRERETVESDRQASIRVRHRPEHNRFA